MRRRLSGHMPLPEMVVEPAPENRPVLVQIAYQIRPAEQDNFVQALEAVRLIRLRDGAFRWDVFCDPGEPGRYVETFEIASWASTCGSMNVQQSRIKRSRRARSYQEPGTEPSVRHLVTARSMSAASRPTS